MRVVNLSPDSCWPVFCARRSRGERWRVELFWGEDKSQEHAEWRELRSERRAAEVSQIWRMGKVGHWPGPARRRFRNR
eukprot:1518770-Pyramimonas_sp.AAC.1